MKIATIIITMIFVCPAFVDACDTEIWKGGLWNLNYKFDISTYGYYRFCLEKDETSESGFVLKIEWIEKRSNLPERVYAFKLFEEIELSFYLEPTMKIEMGIVPSIYDLSNSKGQKISIRLWEPARYKIIAEKN